MKSEVVSNGVRFCLVIEAEDSRESAYLNALYKRLLAETVPGVYRINLGNSEVRYQLEVDIT